jgi:DNA polymerase-1
METEIAQTRVIADMEAVGMSVDPAELGVMEVYLQRELIELFEKIRSKVGWYLNPSSNKDCFQYLCKQCGLPILGFTDPDDEESNPSFGRDELEKYKAFPSAPRDVLSWMLEYRKKSKLKSAFVSPYRTLNDNGVIHATYNQAVRTGRMSCSKPNMQQLNKPAKDLFKPRPGNSFLLFDYSQIEFRLIVHYINDHKAIEAYKENPRTDFHEWMAQLCGISRSAAKRMNFLIGYGGGKKKTCAALMQVDEIIELAQMRVQEQIKNGFLKEENLVAAHTKIVEQIADNAYNTYHAKLPTLKLTSRKVEAVARSRMRRIGVDNIGHVINLYGRHRHLVPTRCHIGFNTICQSTAADLIKERTLALHRALQGTGIAIVAQVHDALMFEGPTDIMRDPRTINDITWLMEHPKILDKLRVPIRTNAGISEVSWLDADAKENDCTIDPVEPSPYPFAHLLESGLTGSASIEYTTAVAG